MEMMRLIIPPIGPVSERHKYESIIREDWKKDHQILDNTIVMSSHSGISGLSYARKNLADSGAPVLDSWLHPIEDDHPKISIQETLFINGEVSYAL